MMYLVHCPCGHALDRHNNDGCAGIGAGGCECRHSELEALDAAINAVASRDWGGDVVVEAFDRRFGAPGG